MGSNSQNGGGNRRRVLEIGGRERPSLLSDRTDIDYVSIDLPDTCFVTSHSRSQRRLMFVEKLPKALDYEGRLAAANMHALPFADGSFDEVIMSNVVGYWRQHTFKLGARRVPAAMDVLRFGLAEVNRVLVDCGRVTIFEEMTPMPIYSTKKYLEYVGFELGEYVFSTDDAYVGFREKYFSELPRRVSSRSYIASATKPESESTSEFRLNIRVDRHQLHYWNLRLLLLGGTPSDPLHRGGYPVFSRPPKANRSAVTFRLPTNAPLARKWSRAGNVLR